MKTALITGSAGLVGSEAVRRFSDQGFRVVGIDNDTRKTIFGDDASTDWRRRELEETLPEYVHKNIDVCDEKAVEAVFAEFGSETQVVIHAAGQPSTTWSAKDPYTDFRINATGTLVMLESTRRFCPDAAFIFTSSYKVYGDRPNHLPLVEHDTRWELVDDHPYHDYGIDELMSVDQTTHCLFGASKLAADLAVQEYGRFFDMNTVCFRCGCLAGPGQTGLTSHGLLARLVRCAITGDYYTVHGYKGKQVHDVLHVGDLVDALWRYYEDPRSGEVYNLGGGRQSNGSILEGIALCEEIVGHSMNVHFSADRRVGDHIWYLSDTRKFQNHYPGWQLKHDIRGIVEELHASMTVNA
jgi:CDP-paratose 2-epimerase